MRRRFDQNDPFFYPKSPKFARYVRNLASAGPIEKGVTQVIVAERHSPAIDGALRQNKSDSKFLGAKDYSTATFSR